ncbi:solute carrier family 2, facilitated glucose transporter member 5-like [Diadema setosum]|uniref:solute carrier family 2, facilitated glucose transporter member 5-like n=1 Tax=Diadema setosum TaxID=31175 RepID=UPI003B3B894A
MDDRKVSDVTLWLVLTIGALLIGSSLKCGYNYGNITPQSIFIKDFYNETNIDRFGVPMSEEGEAWLWGVTTAMFCIGQAIGAIAGSRWSKRYGRCRSLIFNDFISIVASISMASSQAAGSPELLILGRAVIGFSVGVSLTIVPTYLREICPRRLGRYVPRLHNVLFTSGILIGQLLGVFVFSDPVVWPLALGFTALIDLIQIGFLLFCPESPRWLLLEKYAEERAAGAFRQLRNVEDVEKEIQSLREEHRNEERISRANEWDVLLVRDPNWKMPLLSCAILQAGMQLSGINALIFYSTEVFQLAGMTPADVSVATVAWGGIFTAVTIVVFYGNLTTLPRRPLLLYPYFVLFFIVSVLILAVAFHERVDWLRWLAVCCVCAFFTAFAVGPATMTSLVCSELWSRAPRQAALNISQQINMWTDVLIQLIVPGVMVMIGAYTFAIFAGSLLLTSLFICLYLPETRDRRFVEISTGFEMLKSAPTEDEEEGNT